VALPVAELPLERPAADLRALPAAVVGVLHDRRFQGGSLATPQCGVQLAEFLFQYLQRPAIGDAMVHGHREDMPVGAENEKAGTEERPATEVERPLHLLVPD
jgi:hypothetical protein